MATPIRGKLNFTKHGTKSVVFSNDFRLAGMGRLEELGLSRRSTSQSRILFGKWSTATRPR
jgi:hypothetical protein